MLWKQQLSIFEINCNFKVFWTSTKYNAYVCLLVNYFLHRSMESTWCKLLKNSKDKIFCKMKDEIWRGRLCFYLIEASATYLSFRNILESIHGTSLVEYGAEYGGSCLLSHTENLLNFEWVTPTTTMTKNKIWKKKQVSFIFFHSWNSLHGLSTYNKWKWYLWKSQLLVPSSIGEVK